jgi:hypothetical protein
MLDLEIGSGNGFFGVWIWIQSKLYGYATKVSGVIDTAVQWSAVSLTPSYAKRLNFNPWVKGPNGVV